MKTKKMLKRTMSVLLACVLIFGSAPIGALLGLDLFSMTASAAKYSGTCGENLTWTLDTNTGKLTISGTGDMTDWPSASSIPWESYSFCIMTVIIENGVTSIGDIAFSFCDSLESVIIGDSVTSIGDYAFSFCSSLKSVTTGDSVTSIGSGAFQACYSLTSITIPDSVTSIGDAVFFSCESLTSITIPDSVTSIGEKAFYGCTSLESVIIGNSVTSIGNHAFYNCISLTSVTIGNSVTSIDRLAFNNCNKLTDVYYTGDLAEWCGISFASSNANPMYYANNLYIDGKLLSGDIVIPDSVTRIGDYAFQNCKSITNVIIPDSVTRIDHYAFSNCDRIKSVIIPVSVTIIWSGAFDGCKSLTDVYYNASREKWQGIFIFDSSESLTNATMHYREAVDVVVKKTPSKTEYNYKQDELDISGIKLEVTYSDGTKEIVTDTSKMTVSGFFNNKRGEQTVTVEYEGLKAEFKVTVKYTWWQWILVILLFGWIWY